MNENKAHLKQDIEYFTALEVHKKKGELPDFARLHNFVQTKGWRHTFSNLRRTKSYKKSDIQHQMHLKSVLKAMARMPINYIQINGKESENNA